MDPDHSGHTLIELMDITAIIDNPAAVAIPKYFRSIQIASALSVIGHFRIAAGILTWCAASC
nr:hypothetical protein [Acidithiobacillus ferridurans]